MVAAMKCKQGTDPTSADALKSSIDKILQVFTKIIILDFRISRILPYASSQEADLLGLYF